MTEGEQELAFLRERQVAPDDSWVGASSNAMLNQALTGAALPRRFPVDASDLGRCEETYRRAPKHLQERMLPTLVLFRRAVADGGLWCLDCDHGGYRSTWGFRCKRHAEAR